LLTDYRSAEAVWGKFAVDSPLEGDGFEPSVFAGTILGRGA